MKLVNLKSNRKLLIVVNLFLILTLMTVSVYAWFASQVNNTVDAYDIQVQSDDALELSFDGETWGGTLNLADLKKENGDLVLDTMKFVEVTGDGTTFRIPQLTQKTNYAEVNTSGTWTDAVANQDYLEFTVHMRSKDKLSVYLSSDSSASPASSVITGADCGNPSSYASGDDAFSKDCVVGALRVSFENYSGTNYLWITNPEYHLDNKVGSNVYTMDTDATNTTYSDGTGAEGEDFYWNKPNKHYYYNSENTRTYRASNVLVALQETVTSAPQYENTKLALLTEKTGDYYTDEVTFRIWIEGCDTEARRALIDGRFNLSLVFDTFTAE